jgi:hypothetical protein
MDFRLDKKITINDNTKHSSLYNWCLNEYDTNGTKGERDLIPWNYDLYFTGSSLKVVNELFYEPKYDEEYNEKKFDESNKRSVIIGKFHSGLCRDGEYLTDEVTYSMFGTNRKFNDFEVRITASETNVEICRVDGCPSYAYEVDFSDKIAKDYVQLNLNINLDKFNKLLDLIEAKKVDSAVLRLGNVSGFYSDWSPSISTSFVKILTNAHKISNSESIPIVTPVLGDIGEFSLSLITVNKLNVKIDNLNFDIDKAFEQIEVEEVFDDDAHSSVTINNIENSDLTAKAVDKLKLPLWLIFIVLVLLLSK